MNRFQAAGIHLGFSFLIFIVLAYLVVFEWYPGFFFDTDGGWRGMRIIIGVDLILGPMLTLVVYKAGKPGLKFDLGFIALLQTVCLIAGTYVVWAERPLAIVYVDSRFEVMTADDYTVHQLDVPQFSLYPGDDPKWLAVDVPSDPDAQSELRKELFGSGASLSRAADFYKPFNGRDPVFQAEARDVTVILNREDGPPAVDAWLTEHGGTLNDYLFYTFSTRYVYRYIGFDRATGEFKGFLNLQPR